MLFLKSWRALLVVGLVVGLLIYRPETIPEGVWRYRAKYVHDQLQQQKPPDGQKLADMWQATREKVLGAYSSIQQDHKIPGLPEEVVVNDYVDVLTDKVKALPAKQLKQVKQSFCQDVIDEATGSADNKDLTINE
jgi:hypothetical protein